MKCGRSSSGREEHWALGFSGGDEERVHRFVNGEKVAASGGIGDGERLAGFDLKSECFGDAAARPEHVAEAEDDAPGGQDDVLCDALGDAHDGNGLNRLVGGEQDDSRAMALGSSNQRESSEDVVGNCGERLLLK